MAKKKSRQQEKAIEKIWNDKTPFFAILIMAIVASILIFASAEHPKHWNEKDIVISDISKVYIFRGSYYQITDTNNETYSITSSNVEVLVPGQKYHIIYSNIHWNRIKFMSDSNAIYVDYDASVEDYYTRTIIGWIGILGSSAIILVMVRNTLRKIQEIRGKK